MRLIAKTTPLILTLRLFTACVWFVFGVIFKILDLVPRHQTIVASVLGESLARPMTFLIGVAEVCIGLWILSGVRPRVCMTVQTLALVAMNTLEISLAREHLLAPIPMVCANAVFLGAGWYAAMASERGAAPPV